VKRKDRIDQAEKIRVLLLKCWQTQNLMGRNPAEFKTWFNIFLEELEDLPPIDVCEALRSLLKNQSELVTLADVRIESNKIGTKRNDQLPDIGKMTDEEFWDLASRGEL